ncbi:MAG: cytochrome c5 [Colwellia sp.]|jgi:cytochrome c5
MLIKLVRSSLIITNHDLYRRTFVLVLKKMTITLISAVFAFSYSVSADHLSGHSVEKRIAPTGSVYKSGDDVPVAKAPVVETSGPRTAEDIYNTKCLACHGTGVAGAPKLGDVAGWTSRIAAGQETLIYNALNGLNAMPPKGTCTDCSDDEIAKTVNYMVANSQ